MSPPERGSRLIGRISPFQVCLIHIGTFLQYFPRPRVPAPSSYLYRSKNSAPNLQIFRQPFLHQDMVESGHKDSVEQHSVFPKTYPNLSPIAQLLPGTVGTPSCSLSGEVGRDRTLSCNTTQLYIESRHSKCIESLKKHFYNISQYLDPCTLF